MIRFTIKNPFENLGRFCITTLPVINNAQIEVGADKVGFQIECTFTRSYCSFWVSGLCVAHAESESHPQPFRSHTNHKPSDIEFSIVRDLSYRHTTLAIAPVTHTKNENRTKIRSVRFALNFLRLYATSLSREIKKSDLGTLDV
jgi:hypothetical protein